MIKIFEVFSNRFKNVDFRTFQHYTEADTLILFEGYTDQLAVEEHRNSAYFQDIVVKQIVPLLENREVHLTTELAFS